MSIPELREWRDFHKWRATDRGLSNEKIAFHVQAAKDINTRIKAIAILERVKLKTPFEWQVFCEAYRPKSL